MRVLTVPLLVLLIPTLAFAEEAKKSDEQKTSLTIEQCQKFCDIMGESDLTPDVQKNIKFCVRKDFCNIFKADAPPLGLIPTDTVEKGLVNIGEQ